MVFDKYEQLSEDAQRLLCFYVDMGYGSSKRLPTQYLIPLATANIVITATCV